MRVWLNGKFVDHAEATVSLFDAGVQHGVGLFETMCARHGSVFRLMSHLERLKRSAIHLGLLEVLQLGPLARAVELTLEQNQMRDARVRLTVTAGTLAMLKSAGVSSASQRSDPTIAIVVQPPTPYPSELFDRGVRVAFAQMRASSGDPFAGHKTIWYWPRLAELQRAAAMGSSESLFLTADGLVTGGAVSNCFVVKNGALRTPPARDEQVDGGCAQVLPGVTRGVIMECARAGGVDVQVRDLTVRELLDADEVFLTNSSWGVLPVVAVEESAIADAVPGALTLRMRASYRATVESETCGAVDARPTSEE